ncbi:HAMP domain-containing protein (plasmid) [Peteryoungia desertarenae]|uniref:histidine kinase n=1 Tax=Peteryoungia desertarenae TaxID=1813451 RepID=A0ABX6QTU2_9HYPH|nr:sensor histidine kinase [Peteryoungia desertarenae]QLF71909.1 HAMP domain-containing protein [Peteryoungia desertarenae]
MPILKLSRRLFLLTAVGLAPAALILFHNVATMRSEKEREIHAEALRIAQLASLEISRIVSGAENVLVTISATSAIQDLQQPYCNEYLARVRHRLPSFSGISIAGLDGVVRCSREENGVGVSVADRAYFREVLDTQRFTIGTYTVGRISGQESLPLALPVRDELGAVIGVAIGTLNLQWLGQRLRERSFMGNSALTVADRDGVILAREPFPERFVGTQIPDLYQRLVNAVSPGTEVVLSQDGTNRIIGYYPPQVSHSGLYVSAGISTVEAYKPLNSATRFALAVTLAGLGLSLLTAWLTSRQLIRRPITRLVQTVDSWRNSDETARTGMGEADGEFGLVGRAIDDFMDELVESRRQRRRDEQQRELLTAELDHRVKNLIATVQSVARQSFKPGQETSSAVDMFNQRLTALSEAHKLLMKDQWQSARMRDLIRTAIRPFDAQDRSLFVLEGPDFIVRSKAAMAFGMALHELCTNAAKYGALSVAEGRISIRWSLEDPLETGPPAEPKGHEDRRIFRLFWLELDGPQVSPPDRTGFGSRMVERALAAEVNGRVTIDYRPTGLVCEVTAPFAGLRAEERDHHG